LVWASSSLEALSWLREAAPNRHGDILSGAPKPQITEAELNEAEEYDDRWQAEDRRHNHEIERHRHDSKS
jgi:hypothetical protein